MSSVLVTCRLIGFVEAAPGATCGELSGQLAGIGVVLSIRHVQRVMREIESAGLVRRMAVAKPYRWVRNRTGDEAHA